MVSEIDKGDSKGGRFIEFEVGDEKNRVMMLYLTRADNRLAPNGGFIAGHNLTCRKEICPLFAFFRMTDHGQPDVHPDY